MSMGIAHSRALLGVDAPPVRVEVFLSGGLPSFSVSGMAETAVRESKDRVRGAIINSGFKFPQERITVSLGPADMPKSGGRFDLAVALGILAASRAVPQAPLSAVECYGELGLDGQLRPVRGLLTAALRVKDTGAAMFVPADSAAEAAFAGATVLPVRSLLDVTAHLTGRAAIEPETRPGNAPVPDYAADLAAVRGQARPKRALEIAAAGGHNLLLSGPPGTGKSLLARCLPGLLPALNDSEALEVLAVESLIGQIPAMETWRRPPFRSPHHSASAPALVGGGTGPMPGEISRAHRGVLFLDELPEFRRQALEVLREPLETGAICIARANAQVEFPARFMLVAAMNPCPCGYLGDAQSTCRCSGDRVANYRARVSGPLLDRIDLTVDVERPKASLFRGETSEESSAAVRDRVIAARRRQSTRQETDNASLPVSALDDVAPLDETSWQVLEQASERLNLSARGLHRTLRVARTVADLAGETTIAPAHIAEAVSFRRFRA